MCSVGRSLLVPPLTSASASAFMSASSCRAQGGVQLMSTQDRPRFQSTGHARAEKTQVHTIYCSSFTALLHAAGSTGRIQGYPGERPCLLSSFSVSSFFLRIFFNLPFVPASRPCPSIPFALSLFTAAAGVAALIYKLKLFLLYSSFRHAALPLFPHHPPLAIREKSVRQQGSRSSLAGRAEQKVK